MRDLDAIRVVTRRATNDYVHRPTTDPAGRHILTAHDMIDIRRGPPPFKSPGPLDRVEVLNCDAT